MSINYVVGISTELAFTLVSFIRSVFLQGPEEESLLHLGSVILSSLKPSRGPYLPGGSDWGVIRPPLSVESPSTRDYTPNQPTSEQRGNRIWSPGHLCGSWVSESPVEKLLEGSPSREWDLVVPGSGHRFF